MPDAAPTDGALTGRRSGRGWLARLSPFQLSFAGRPELDGLRGLAVLLTVFFHLELYTPRVVALDPDRWLSGALNHTAAVWSFGATGVHLFFVLSGFLLFRPYAAAMLKGAQPPDTSRFFDRRAAPHTTRVLDGTAAHRAVQRFDRGE